MHESGVTLVDLQIKQKGEEKNELQKQESRDKLGKKGIVITLHLLDHWKRMNRGNQGKKGIEFALERIAWSRIVLRSIMM